LLEISEFKDNIEKIVTEQSTETLIKYYNYLFPRVFEYKNMLECLNQMKSKTEDLILLEMLNNSLNILWKLPEFNSKNHQRSTIKGLRQSNNCRGFDFGSMNSDSMTHDVHRRVGTNRLIMSEDEEWLNHDKSRSRNPDGRNNTSFSLGQAGM